MTCLRKFEHNWFLISVKTTEKKMIITKIKASQNAISRIVPLILLDHIAFAINVWANYQALVWGHANNSFDTLMPPPL